MKLNIRLLKPFSDVVGTNKLMMYIDGFTLEDLITALIERHPKLRNEFMNDSGRFSEYISVFINDKPISALNGLNTELKDGDTLVFFLPLTGG